MMEPQPESKSPRPDSKSPEAATSAFLARAGAAPRRALLIDYDGTIAPFSGNRQASRPYPGVAEALAGIGASSTHLWIVSGRPVEDLDRVLKLAGRAELWGSHGLERMRDGRILSEPAPAETSEFLERVAADILAAGRGETLERKPFGVAVHWRGVPPEIFAAARAALARWTEAARARGLEPLEFDGGVELRPLSGHKGLVVRRAFEELGADAAVAYLGDDRTDEDAFRELRGRGLSVLVREQPRPTEAEIWIRPPEGLLGFLAQWRRAFEDARE